MLVISAKDGEVDQADGLDLGADGYLVKPFSFLVLLAQVHALLRRGGADRGGTSRAGQLVVDRASKHVSWAGHLVALSPREYTVIHALVSRPGAVLSKDELLRAAWGDEEAATRNAVEVYVGYLRRKLEAVGAGHLVHTVRGHGYRLASLDRTDQADLNTAHPPQRTTYHGKQAVQAVLKALPTTPGPPGG